MIGVEPEHGGCGKSRELSRESSTGCRAPSVRSSWRAKQDAGPALKKLCPGEDWTCALMLLPQGRMECFLFRTSQCGASREGRDHVHLKGSGKEWLELWEEI